MSESEQAEIGVLGQSASECPEQTALAPYLLDQGVWEYNFQNGSFTASTAWFDLRGAQQTDVTLEDWFGWVHPDDQDSVGSVFANDEHAKRDVRYRHVCADGECVWILSRSDVIERGANGQPIRIIGTDTNITRSVNDQDSLHRLDEKLKLAVEAAGIGVWEYDPLTHTVRWDDRMLEIYGITDGENERSGDAWPTYLHEDDRDETLAYVDRCRQLDQVVNHDYRIVTPNGIRYVRTMARNIETPDGGKRFVGVNLDVTEDHESAEELIRSKREAERSNLAKSNFLANMSHELRTPLNAVMGFSETMAIEALGPMPDTYKDYARDINSSAKHLLAMIEQLLDLSRIEAGKISLSPENIPLAELIREVVQTVSTAYDRPLADFSVTTTSIEKTVHADLRALRQVFINLVSNAAKFSEAGTPITIEGHSSRLGFEIIIQDRGIGIPEKDIESIFEPYNRSSSVTAQQSHGTGLGLPISQALVEKHGGSLTLRSQLEIGTTVTMTLPNERITEPRPTAIGE